MDNVCALYLQGMDLPLLCFEQQRMKQHKKLIGSNMYQLEHKK